MKIKGSNYVKRGFVFFFVNHVFSGVKFFKIKNKLLGTIGIKTGNNTKIVGPIFCSGNLTIGENCWIGREIHINGNGSVIIGDNCDIAPEVTFFTGGHEIGNGERRAGKGQSYNITVGNGTWICGRSTILGNTEIGNSSVIAAGALVNKNVADNVLVGGVPAKIIRSLNVDA